MGAFTCTPHTPSTRWQWSLCGPKETYTSGFRGCSKAGRAQEPHTSSRSSLVDTCRSSNQAHGGPAGRMRACCCMGCWATARAVGGASFTYQVAGRRVVTAPCWTDGADVGAGDGSSRLLSSSLLQSPHFGGSAKGLSRDMYVLERKGTSATLIPTDLYDRASRAQLTRAMRARRTASG